METSRSSVGCTGLRGIQAGITLLGWKAREVEFLGAEPPCRSSQTKDRAFSPIFGLSFMVTLLIQSCDLNRFLLWKLLRRERQLLLKRLFMKYTETSLLVTT